MIDWYQTYWYRKRPTPKCYFDVMLGTTVHKFNLGEIKCCCGKMAVAKDEDRVHHGWRKPKPEPA